MKPVGQIIREARKKVGVTQKQLADMCGVKRAVISKYESGDIDLPVSRLILIADKLNINLGVLSEPPKVRCPVCDAAQDADSSPDDCERKDEA